MNRIYKLVKNKRTGCLVVASELAKGCKKGSKLLRLTSLMTLLTAFSFQSFGSDYTIKENNDSNTSIANIYDKTTTINLNDSTFGFDNIESGKEVVKHEVSVNSKFKELYQTKYQDVSDAENAFKQEEENLKPIETSYKSAQTSLSNAVNRFNTAEAALNKAKEELENATEEEKETKQNAFNTAKTNFNTAEKNKSEANDKLIPIKESYESAKNLYDAANNKLAEATAKADDISDERFKIDHPDLINSTSELAKITIDEVNYLDVVTGRSYKLKTVKEMTIEEVTAEEKSEITSIIFYEKTDKNDQYDSGVIANVTGKDTTVTIQNNDGSEESKSKEINAISKNGSGIIKVDDGANLTYDAKTNYYTGGSLSKSEVFDEKQLDMSSKKTNYKVEFSTSTDNYWGKSAKSADEFNTLNEQLKEDIKNNKDGLQDRYPTPEEMQEFYDNEINKLYKLVEKDSYKVNLKLTEEELVQAIKDNNLETEYENRVTKKDEGTDIGLDLTDDNYFIGVTGSHSTIEITEDAEITNGVKNDDAENPKSLISGGTVIKANFDDSGKNEQNTINIKGKISTAGSAITAKNASVNVFETGKIEGSITFDEVTNKDNQNKLTNLGSITGEISAKDTIIKNKKSSDDVIGKIIGNIITNNVEIENTGKIDGSITASGKFDLNNTTSDSTNIKFGEDHIITGNIYANGTSNIVNDKNATIIGTVTNNGADSTFENHGFVGGIYSYNKAQNTNDGEIINSTYKAVLDPVTKKFDYQVIKLENESELTNSGDIYLGYYYLLDKDNNRINKYGYFIDENNNLVDNKGKIYDEDGSKSDEFGYIIDKNGNKKIKPIADAGNGTVSSGGLNANGIKGIIDISVKGKGSKFTNNKNIYLSESQVDTIVLQVENGGEYEDINESVISTFYNEKLSENLHKDYGNQNKLVVSMDEGSKVTINGTVQLEDVGSIGLQSLNGGTIILNGIVNLFSHNLKDEGNRSTGLWAQGVANKGISTLIMNGDSKVNINSNSGIGVHIRSNSKVEINGNSSITFGSDKKDQIGFLISGIGSGDTAIAYNSKTAIELAGINTVLFRIERGSSFTSKSLIGEMKELNSNGTDGSTLLQFTTSPRNQNDDDQFNNKDEKGHTVGSFGNFELNVNEGENSRGVAVEGGAEVTIIPKTIISISGNNNTLATIDNHYYDLHQKDQGATNYGTSKLISSAILSSSENFNATNSIGYHIKNGGKLEHLGQIDFTGQSDNNNIGVKIESGGTLVSKVGSEIIDSPGESFIKVKGTAIEIDGSGSTATVENQDNCKTNENDCYKPVVLAIGDKETKDAAAYHLKNGASLTLKNNGITKAEGTAHGILIDKGSKVILQGGTIIDLYAKGDYAESTGNGIENRSSSANSITFNNATINVNDGNGIHSSVGFSSNNDAATGGKINVYGNGTGIRFEGIDENGTVTGSTTNSISNTGFESVVINVYEKEGHGIYVNSTKDVTTSTSVNILNKDGNSALEVNGKTKKVTQSGNLYSASVNTPIVDLENGYVNSFTNTGKILFGTFDENNSFARLSDKDGSKYNAIEIETSGKEFEFTNNGEINGVISLKVTNSEEKGNTIKLGEKSVGNIFKTAGSNNNFIIEKVVGDDRGGDKQIKAFVSLEGGGDNDSITFKTGTDFTITKKETIKDIENFILEGASKINLDLGDNTSDGFNEGTTSYEIGQGSNLIYNWNNSNLDFNKTLKGAGTLTVNLKDKNATNEFAFGTSDKTNTKDFTGTLELTNTNYNLSDSNSSNVTALTNATLKASDNSYIIVGEGKQEIKGLNFNGGTVDFGKIDLSDEISANNIKLTDSLTLNKGKVKVDVSGDIHAKNPGVPSSSPILDQGSAVIYTKLVSADKVNGSAANINAYDQDGKEIKNYVESSIIQNKEEVARGTYGTRFISEDIDHNKGLYLGYGLKQIELKAKNNNALVLNADDSNSNTLDAKVTDYKNDNGTFIYGDLQISGNKEVILSNNENDYHGSTYVQEGAKLIAGDNNSLGNTRLLQLNNNASFDLGSLTQSIGSLETKENAKVELNGGTLNITGVDGTQSNSNHLLTSNISANTLWGSGSLNFGKSVDNEFQNNLQKLIVNIDGDNSNLSANALNNTISTINLNSLAGLGDGELTNQGTLNLNIDSSGKLSNKAISGDGKLNKNGSGTLEFTLAQAGEYLGTVNINSGKMIFSGNSSSNNIVDNENTKNNTSDNPLTRSSTENSNNTAYKLDALNIKSGGTFVGLKNTNLSSTDIFNSGTMYIGHDSSGNQTVNGDSVTVRNYTGESGSKLIFNGEMEGDDSIINKLIIKGDSNGSSLVKVNRIGGQGAKTVNGIVIIEVDGESNAEFTLSDRVIAGAYEYKLCRVNDQKSCMNTNNLTIQTGKNFALYTDFATRTEMGGYIDNLYIANNLFNLRLHDRLGETQYTDLLTGEKKVTSMWLRTSYGYNKYQVANGDLNVKDNWNVTQIGGDIATWSDNTLNRFHLGVMAGKGGNSAKVKSSSTGLQSTTSLSGYSLGVYGTWYNNDRDKTGLYLDSWAMWNTFKNDVSGKEFSEKYHSKGLTASIESGYSFVAKKFNHYDFWLQPKGQIILQGVKEKERVEDKGTRIKTNYGNVQTRLGLRASLLSNKNDVKKQSNFSGQIFTEVNWLHNSKTYSVTTNDETTLSQDGARNIGEIKFGLESNIKQKTNLWFNVSAQYGDYGYKNAAFTGGLKYSF